MMAVTVRMILLIGFSVEVVSPSLFQKAGEAISLKFLVLMLR
jgi:hypothetical protein